MQLTAYGVMIALGVLAAVALACRRLEQSGGGRRDDMSAIGMWAVAGGLVGARLYHVVTAWELFRNDLGRIPMVWTGGLGIPGGLLGGAIAAALAARHRGLRWSIVADAAAPGVALAQAIGRWGNWWNQELFGRPTSLPWGLRIADDKVPAGYDSGTLFHPTFLYESIWNLVLCAVLLALDRRRSFRAGHLFGIYLIGYFSGRFWIEGLRIDPAHQLAGLRLNQWVAAAVIVVTTALMIVDARRSDRNVVGPDPGQHRHDDQIVVP